MNKSNPIEKQAEGRKKQGKERGGGREGGREGERKGREGREGKGRQIFKKRKHKWLINMKICLTSSVTRKMI